MLYTLESTIRQENRREKCSNPFFCARTPVCAHTHWLTQTEPPTSACLVQHTNTMAHPSSSSSSRISSSCNSFKFKTKPNIVIRRPTPLPPTRVKWSPFVVLISRCARVVWLEWKVYQKHRPSPPTTIQTALSGCYFPPTRVGNAIWCGGWESGLFRMWGGYLLLKLYVIITKRVSRYWFAMAEINLELFWKTWTWLLFLEELPVDARQLFPSNPLDRCTGSGEVWKILLSDTLKT